MLNMGLVRTNYIWAEEFFQPIIKHQTWWFDGDFLVVLDGIYRD